MTLAIPNIHFSQCGPQLLFFSPWLVAKIPVLHTRSRHQPDIPIYRTAIAKPCVPHQILNHKNSTPSTYRKDPSAWLSNPQFLIFVKEKTPCLIVLSQKDARMVGGAQAANRIKGGQALEGYGR